MTTPLPDRVRDLRASIDDHETRYEKEKRAWFAVRTRGYNLNTRRAELSRELVLALLGRGYTQQRLAGRLGLSQQRVQQVAYGRATAKGAFPMETIERLAELLETKSARQHAREAENAAAEDAA